MPRPKTEKGKLAELVAKQRHIKKGSAYQYVRRAELRGQVPKDSGLSKYAAGKLRADIKTAAPKKKRPVEISEIAEVERKNYSFDGLQLFKGFGSFKLGSGGRKSEYRTRPRYVREMFSSDMINDVLNAATFDDAMLIFANYVPYVAEAIEPEYFEFRGERYGPEWFN